MSLSIKILQTRIKSLPSEAQIIQLNKTMATLSKLQMTLISDLVIIKQRLVLKLAEEQKTLSDMIFTITEVTAEGVASEVEEAGGVSETSSVDDLTLRKIVLGKTQTSLGLFNNV